MFSMATGNVQIILYQSICEQLQYLEAANYTSSFNDLTVFMMRSISGYIPIDLQIMCSHFHKPPSTMAYSTTVSIDQPIY